MGTNDKDRDEDDSPNPNPIRPKGRETPEEKMAADWAWCKANGLRDLFYSWYPGTRPPERSRGGRGGR
jgi:hypothetical protein